MANITEEERRRRSELAQRLYQEGRFGGPQPGSGRPRKKRATELVAEAAKDQADQILQVFRDAIDENQPINMRLKAAADWLNIEAKEESIAIQEERALEGMHRDVLIAELAQKMSRLIERGVISPEVLGQAKELTSGD